MRREGLNPLVQPTSPAFDVFLSYPHEESAWVEQLGERLEDEHGFRVWLDKWILVPGGSWQQAMTKGLDEAQTCAICIGSRTPDGWFREEIERALDIQTQRAEFRAIPILLPDASPDLVPAFLRLRTWADFRNGNDPEYALHVLCQGIRGLPVGRWAIEPKKTENSLAAYERKLRELQRLADAGIYDEVIVEFQRKILSRWFDEK